jgi:predicted DNA-binding protein YlxM (UPF0122 family)
MNEFNENLARATIIACLAVSGAVFGHTDFWDKYWPLVSTLNNNTQVGIAGKLAKFGPYATSEQSFNTKYSKTLALDTSPELTNKQIHDNYLEELLDEAIDTVLSERAAGILRLYYQNQPVKDIALAFKISPSLVYNCISESIPKIQAYITKEKEWYDVYQDEVNRDSKPFNTLISGETDAVRLAREFIEEALDCSTSRFINSSHQVSYNKFAINHPSNLFLLETTQLTILAASIVYAETHPNIVIYIKNNSNNFDVVKIRSGSSGVNASQRDDLITFTITDTPFNKTEDMLQVYPIIPPEAPVK